MFPDILQNPSRHKHSRVVSLLSLPVNISTTSQTSPSSTSTSTDIDLADALTAFLTRNPSLDLPYPLLGPRFLSSDLAINDACLAALEPPAEDGQQYQIHWQTRRKTQLLPESRGGSRRFSGTIHTFTSNNPSSASPHSLSHSHSFSLASNGSHKHFSDDEPSSIYSSSTSLHFPSPYPRSSPLPKLELFFEDRDRRSHSFLCDF